MLDATSTLEKKLVLIDRVNQLLDLLYPKADASKDQAIQLFRDEVLQLLVQLRKTDYEGELRILIDFENQLKTILVEVGDRSALLKDNVSNRNFYNINVNSNNSANKNAQLNLGNTEIILNQTNYSFYSYHNETRTEPPTLNEQKEDLALLFERFYSFYKAQHVKRTFGESKEGERFDDLYTRLALIREREVKEDRERYRKDLLSLKHESPDLIARDEHLHLFEHILYTERKPIEEEQLFLPMEDDVSLLRHKGRIDRILIRGQAGVGKTTFCYHLARKLVEQSHWVFVVPLRHLRNISGGLTDIDVIEKALVMKLTESERTLLAQLFTDKTQPIVWLLDGLDEVRNLLEDHPLQQWLREAFQKEQLIVTTRPRAVQEFHAERQVEMIGYLPEDVERYVTRYFEEDSNKIQTFMYFIKQQKQLGAIHRIPIILELMCWLWDDLMVKQSNNTIQLSFTDLYVHFLQGLIQRYLKKNSAWKSLVEESTNNEIEEMLRQPYHDPLLELSYQTFTANQLIFTGEDVKNCLMQVNIDDRRKILHEFGLVRCLRDIGSFDRNEFTFIHLTAHEFLMAKRWVQLFTSVDSSKVARAVSLLTGRKDRSEWVDSHKYDKRFEVVWGFVAGLLKGLPTHLQCFLDLIAAPPRDQIGARHIALLFQIMGETNGLQMNTREYKEIAAWLNDSKSCGIGLQDYAPILARYPELIRRLQEEWDKLWARQKQDGDDSLVIDLLSIVPLDEKGKIYRDLIDELKTTIELPYTSGWDYVRKAVCRIPLTQAQREEIIRPLFNVIRNTNRAKATHIETLGRLYSKEQLSQEFQSNLVDQLLAYIEEANDESISAAAHLLGKMNLPEEKYLSIIDKLLARWRQEAQFEFDGNRRSSILYILEALGKFPIPDKRQSEVTQFLLNIINNIFNNSQCSHALATLSKIDPPDTLRMSVVSTLLVELKSHKWDHPYLPPLEKLCHSFSLLSYRDQAHLLDFLLDCHLEGENYKRNRLGLSILKSINIPKDYETLVLNALWKCFYNSNREIKVYAAENLLKMNILEEELSQIINILLNLMKKPDLINDDIKIRILEILETINIPQKLKPSVISKVFKIFLWEVKDEFSYILNDIVKCLGRIGISLKLSKKISKLSYACDKSASVLNELNIYCIILDDDLPRYLQGRGAMYKLKKGIKLTTHLLFRNYKFKSKGIRWKSDYKHQLSVSSISGSETNKINNYTQVLSQLANNSNNQPPTSILSSQLEETIKDGEDVVKNGSKNQMREDFAEIGSKPQATLSVSVSESPDDVEDVKDTVSAYCSKSGI